MVIIQQSKAIRVPLQAYLDTDHISPGAGKTIAITISKNGAAFGNPNAGATNATEIATGSYYVDLDTTDTGTAGPLIVRGTNADIDDIIAMFIVVADEIGAIKAKTDSLTFTVPGQVDANAESINATTVLGNGTSGNKWRG